MNTLVIICLLLLALCAFCVLYYFVFIRPKCKVKKSATTKEPPPSPANSPPSATEVCVPDESEYLTTRPMMDELVMGMSAKDDSVRDSIVTLEPIKTDPITNEPIEENAESLVDDLAVGGASDIQTSLESSPELIDNAPDGDSDDGSDEGSDVDHDDGSDEGSDADHDDEHLSTASVDSDKDGSDDGSNESSDDGSIEDSDDAPKEFTFVPTLKQKRKAALFKVHKA